jgi:hypothetical protein
MNVMDLSDVKGELCISMKSVDFKEPYYTVSHYPTGVRTRTFISDYGDLKDWDVVTQGSTYAILPKKNSYGRSYTLHLADGGKTKSVKFEKIPIPCPKVKSGIKTRWSSDKECWMKELKTGWTRC